MHLLYLGVMKYLMEHWIVKKSVARLKRKEITNFRNIMLSLTPDVPCEFQRKKFDINVVYALYIYVKTLYVYIFYV